jgi:hypothetical protein
MDNFYLAILEIMRGLQNEVRFRFIKVMDMGYMVILYFLFAIFLSKVTDSIFGGYSEEEMKKKSTVRLTIEVIATLWFNMVLFYIARNVMELVPSPFDGLYGYEHSRLKEVTNTAILGLTYLYFQSGFRSKLGELNARLSLTSNPMDGNRSFTSMDGIDEFKSLAA